jgi:hypothetical protein
MCDPVGLLFDSGENRRQMRNSDGGWRKRTEEHLIINKDSKGLSRGIQITIILLPVWKSVSKQKDKTRDHVPPSSVFKVADKSPALILLAHQKCNGGQSIGDEELGQLIGLLHGNPVSLDKSRFKIGTGTFPDKTQSGVVPINMSPILSRWIRGFHAGLYNELLPFDTKGAIHLPMPSLKRDGNEMAYTFSAVTTYVSKPPRSLSSRRNPYNSAVQSP